MGYEMSDDELRRRREESDDHRRRIEALIDIGASLAVLGNQLDQAQARLGSLQDRVDQALEHPQR